MSTKEERVKVWLRVSEAERGAIHVAAALTGMNTTEFCAKVLVDTAMAVVKGDTIKKLSSVGLQNAAVEEEVKTHVKNLIDLITKGLKNNEQTEVA